MIGVLEVHSMRKEYVRMYNSRIDDYEDNVVYILNCTDTKKDKYEAKIYEEHGDCPSGWCAASWGYINYSKVDSFVGNTHMPIKKLMFVANEKEGTDVQNDIFTVDYDGGDYWYPCGFVEMHEELFKETPRLKEKRPVWIFKGHSGLGKSYLAGIINDSQRNKTVYETDAHSELEKINEDIIVLGNKYDYSVADVESMIQGEHETIVVDFSKYKEREISRGE